MTAPINNTFYADPQGLTALRKGGKAQDPAALKEAAKQFESLFTQMLLKSMREANKSFGESMFESEQTEFYQDMFDDQMAVHMSQGKGLGLADMLVRQLQGTVPQQGTVPISESASSKGSAAEMGTFLINSGSSREIRNVPISEAKPLIEPIAASKSDFIKQMLPHAEAAARELGVDPHALLAQAALETGWGKSVPCNAAGECSFNLFGIKAGTQWSGAAVNVPTLEFEEGVAVRKVERFRAYESPADSFADYAKLIGNNARYENAVGTGDNVAAFASALQRGGYATDPNYARKLVAVANELRNLASKAGV
jgi:peptidoglycan hydrolase FlgJ